MDWVFRYLYFFIGTSLTLGVTSLAWAETPYLIDIQHISTENGLPHRRVKDLLQDRQGYLWICNPGKISRFDGVRFQTFGGDVLGLGKNEIPEIALDEHQRIWYMDGNNHQRKSAGIFDPHSGKVWPISALTGGRIQADDILYIGNPQGDIRAVYLILRQGQVFRYDGRMRMNHLLDHAGLTVVHDLYVGPLGYWISHDRELLYVDLAGKRARRYDMIGFGRRLLQFGGKLVVEDYDWVGGKFQYYTVTEEGLLPYPLQAAEPGKRLSLMEIQDGVFALATERAVLVQTQAGQLLHKIDHPGDQGAWPMVIFNSTMRDRSHNLWIGTDEGMFKFQVIKNHFAHSQVGNSMRGILEVGGKRWTSGYRGNWVTDLASGQTETFLGKGEVALSMQLDLQGRIWFGTGTGHVVCYEPQTGRYVDYPLDCQPDLSLVFQNRVSGNYWIGASHGLLRFDPTQNKAWEYDLPSEDEPLQVRQILQNRWGMWVVSSQGLYLISNCDEGLLRRFTTRDGLPSNDLNHLYVDERGIYWFATRDAGLLRYDPLHHDLRQFDVGAGLSNNRIYAVYADDGQALWLPSDRGLMAFDKTSFHTRTFLPHHGIAHYEFNTFSHFQAQDGTLHFGGLNGITSFHPRDVRAAEPSIAPLVVTRVTALEGDSDRYSDLTADFALSQDIHLPHDTRVLEIELALLDYERPSDNQFAYQFGEGEGSWTQMQGNKLIFNNLRPGDYTLRIQGRSPTGRWTLRKQAIRITVALPYYLRLPFVTGCAVFILVLMALGFRWRLGWLQQDRKRLELEVERRTAQIAQDHAIIAEQAAHLKTLDQAKTRFFTNVTHEFRTPLTLVLGPLTQILTRSDLPTDLGGKLQGVQRNAEQLLTLINQLLDLSKIEHHLMRVEPSHGDIVLHTREQVARFQPLAEQNGLLLQCEIAHETWVLDYDSDKWEKVVFNLLSNAMKFTPSGGTVVLRLQPMAETGGLLLEVADSGIGISAAHQSHIFERFYQVEGYGKGRQAGTGLGLALVKELVELQGGHISVQSQPQKGTRFQIRLPIMHITETSETNTAADINDEELLRGAALPLPEPDERCLVLLIDDHPEILAYVHSCLDPARYTVIQACDGESGLAMAIAQVPDLIVSDVMMPGLDGYALVQAIRSHVATSHIPLILLSAKSSLDSRMEGIRHGADAYLSKPFSPAELVLRIDTLIASRLLLQARYAQVQAPAPGAHMPSETQYVQEDRFVAALKAYVVAHLSEPDLNGDRIGNHFAMSRMQLHRKLKALTPYSISDFVRMQRLLAAQALLADGQLTIAEVAYETGFTSPSHFSRSFRKEFGMAPSEGRHA